MLTTRQKRRFVDTNSVQIQTPTATITPSTVEQLLGAQVHQDMRWVEHILDSDKSLVKALNLRIGALKKIGQVASFKTRKTIANGIFMSKLIYLMPLWSGCEEYLVNCLQVILNKAARAVTKLNIFTSTKVLMKACGWMSVRQLMAYHSLVLLHKTMTSQRPEYLYQKVTSGGEYSYKTRQAAACPPGFSFEVTHPTDSGSIRHGTGPKHELSRQSWCWKSVDDYNNLPSDLKLERKLPSFKKRLKDWIELNFRI